MWDVLIQAIDNHRFGKKRKAVNRDLSQMLIGKEYSLNDDDNNNKNGVTK